MAEIYVLYVNVLELNTVFILPSICNSWTMHNFFHRFSDVLWLFLSCLLSPCLVHPSSLQLAVDYGLLQPGKIYPTVRTLWARQETFQTLAFELASGTVVVEKVLSHTIVKSLHVSQHSVVIGIGFNNSLIWLAVCFAEFLAKFQCGGSFF